MSNRRQRLRKEVIKVWKDNTGSTGLRDTQYNELLDEYKVSNSFASLVWRKAKSDIEA